MDEPTLFTTTEPRNFGAGNFKNRTRRRSKTSPYTLFGFIVKLQPQYLADIDLRHARRGNQIGRQYHTLLARFQGQFCKARHMLGIRKRHAKNLR